MEDSNKRETVEVFLSNFCHFLDEKLANDDEWEEWLKSLFVLVHDELGLIGAFDSFYYYFPNDEDIEILYPIIVRIKPVS